MCLSVVHFANVRILLRKKNFFLIQKHKWQVWWQKLHFSFCIPSLGDLLFKGLTLQFLKWSRTQHSMWCEIGQFLGVMRRVADFAAYWTRQRAESVLKPRLSLTSMAGAFFIRQLVTLTVSDQQLQLSILAEVPLIHVFHNLKHTSFSFTCLYLVLSELPSLLRPYLTCHCLTVAIKSLWEMFWGLSLVDMLKCILGGIENFRKLYCIKIWVWILVLLWWFIEVRCFGSTQHIVFFFIEQNLSYFSPVHFASI